MMFYTKDEYNKIFERFFNNKGMIVKLLEPNHTSNDEVFGYVTRMESDRSDDFAQVVINISLCKKYIKNEYDDKKFTVRDYKYFSLKHLFNEIKKEEFPETVNINDIKSILLYIESYNIKNVEMKDYILKNILNVKKYYKNKRIELFLL